ncbi:MAG: sugar ABC transporter permease [bacterium]|nr:sugar ABC transporter permease [bacterium]
MNKANKGILGLGKGEFALIVPAMALNILILVVPAIVTVYFSFTRWNGLGMPEWVGFENYAWVFSNRVSIGAFFNNIKWMAFFLVVPFIISLTAASLMYILGGKSKRFQIVFYLPVAQSRIITASIFSAMIFHPISGVYGWLAKKGLTSFAISPLTVPSTALWTVAVVDCWAWWGFLAIIFFSAMRQIDKNLIEASRIDGANGFQQFFHIILPSIKSNIAFMFLMTIIWSLKAFDFVYMITKGGPGYASELMATLAYKTAFEGAYIGRGAAVSLILTLLASIVIFFYVYLQSKSDDI